ncbi:MAG: lamin tail domain-containing protein, partial [Pontiellaceae bacterium]|nr:lamin tail domain-containing protein [Pontiellaceae bacterium]
LTAAGSGIGGTSDEAAFCHQTYTGDFDVQVCVAGMSFADTWARAGLMARDGLEPNALFAAVLSSSGPAGCHFMSRSSVGSNAEQDGYFPTCFPDQWLRLRRSGNLFEGFAGLDGESWELLGSATVAMSGEVEVGFVLSSADTNETATADFGALETGAGTIVSHLELPFEPLGPSSRRGAMVFSEIMIDTPSEWGGTNSLEFVEIYNSGLITEDLTGHRLTGEIDYDFPAGAMLAPGQFMVIAKDPAAAQAFYGVNCYGPYDGKLANSGGTLRLRNELDGILLEVEYNDKAPWPVAVFGTGHSMVLSHPSYGENDARAWSPSDVIGGSPGRAEGYGAEPARGVVINEYLAHTDLPQVDYVELFNAGTNAVDLSGAWLSDEAGTNRFRMADGTTIPARGFLSFDQMEMGFALSADGEQIFLVNSNQTRVLDAVSFRGQANGVSEGRYPDGAPEFQSLDSVTKGNANTAPKASPVVINEIMYHPISDSNNDEYIELYNRTASAVDLSGWRLQGGISYEFPSNTVIAAGAYLVVAENRTNLIARYTQLNESNTYGNYSGSLANGGERIALSMVDDLISTNALNEVTTNWFYIPIDEVTYLDGGRWGEWSDAGGSSLELIDPDADNRQPSSWADSDESDKAPWTTIDVTDILENGQAGSTVDEGGWYGEAADCNRLELFMQGVGEVLIDDVEFLNNGGSSLVQNGDFSDGTSFWGYGGVARNSYVESGVGEDGSAAFHLVSDSRGDTGCNKAYNSLSSVPFITGSDTGTIRAKVRWLRGAPQILLRLRGNWMEVSCDIEVPTNCGTPGLVNSRRVSNAGPSIYDVSHFPILPDEGEDVVVTARAVDPDGIASMTLNYRIDPAAGYTSVTMNDSGSDGDKIAGDGIYSGTVPGQSTGYMAAFVVSGSDGSATAQFPAAAPERECLVRWGEERPTGGLGAYRLWVTSSNITFWAAREKNANDTMDATFVYGDWRVVYNVDTMYSGSPFHVGAYDGPLGVACDYEINFHPGERFLGTEPFVLAAEGTGNSFWDDETTQVDLTGTWIARKLGQQYNYRRHIHMYVNGNRRGGVYLDSQQPNSDMLDEYFPNDSQSELRKIESWFEFADDFVTQGSVYSRIGQVNKTSGGIDPKWYRWNWRPRATKDHNNWFNFTNLVAAVNNSGAPDYEAQVYAWMDVRNFLRPIVTHHVCGSWDSYAYDRGKNMYAFKPDNGGFRLIMWDIELALGNGSYGTTDSIYWSQDSVLMNMITSIPSVHREYLMAFQDAVDGPMAPGVADVILNERYENLVASGIEVSSPDSIISFLSSRRNYIQGVLPTADFGVSGAASYSVSTNVTTVTGTAPLQVAGLLINGITYPLEWTSTTAWSMNVPLLTGTNTLSMVGVDRFGAAVSGATAELTVIRTDDEQDPLDLIVINEWMADNGSVLADPADGDFDDWFELYNPGSTDVDLGGCYLTDDLTDPFQFQVPDNGHYVVPAGGYLLVWADGESSQNSTNQPDLHVGFSLSKSGESIGLYASDGREIDTVTFGAQAEDISAGRYPVGGNTIVALSEATPGGANAEPSALPVAMDIVTDGSGLSFSWISASGYVYQVYYKTNLLDAAWLPAGEAQQGTGESLGFTGSVFNAQGYYIIVFE